MILDSAGNALAAFADEWSARAALHAMIKVEPDAADHVVLLAYGDDGIPVGEALSPADVAPAVNVEPSEFVVRQLTDALVRQIPRSHTRYVGGTIAVWAPRIQDAPQPLSSP